MLRERDLRRLRGREDRVARLATRSRRDKGRRSSEAHLRRPVGVGDVVGCDHHLAFPRHDRLDRVAEIGGERRRAWVVGSQGSGESR